MRKIILGLATFILSTNVFASMDTSYEARTLDAGIYTTQDQAYAAGAKKTEQLKTLPTQTLANELSVWGSKVLPQTLKIDNTEVLVESISAKAGDGEYRAMVKVNYHYQIRDNGRN
ncbi:DUF3316 domain-containing protein [Vibrio cholerae]|uniref:DUF3316 domain-containing protein n=1 Tax=Vibrio cholerae TaxID=666 RepID=UPI000E6BD21B|nr:DUF3316 domain-containing protein [Vibrio cholerae]MCD1188079.1 DUF3316 domain-containing protein [Vibrio cholerae]MCD1194589.1 acyl-CoA synthetase [Vibrio cholerae]MCD1198290.1 acyl-CoA synthetase [Vibrio cholerae]GHW66175.1 acyl-CoA synthetase [Vibrio cholerae]HDZ9125539.1 DUF3316 domain-containing protein [Vibrio cholerae]